MYMLQMCHNRHIEYNEYSFMYFITHKKLYKSLKIYKCIKNRFEDKKN